MVEVIQESLITAEHADWQNDSEVLGQPGRFTRVSSCQGHHYNWALLQLPWQIAMFDAGLVHGRSVCRKHVVDWSSEDAVNCRQGIG
jgi:hypothetical protein